MKVYVDKSDLTQVLDCVYRGEKEVYVLVDNSRKNENALHFLDLAEHDKQVRKEVVQEIKVALREKLIKMEEDTHCYPQNSILWQDVVAILEKKIKENDK